MRECRETKWYAYLSYAISVVLAIAITVSNVEAHIFTVSKPMGERILLEDVGGAKIELEPVGTGGSYKFILTTTWDTMSMGISLGSETLAACGKNGTETIETGVLSGVKKYRVYYSHTTDSSTTGWGRYIYVSYGQESLWEIEDTKIVPSDTSYDISVVNQTKGLKVRPSYSNSTWRNNEIGEVWDTNDNIYVITIAGRSDIADMYITYYGFTSSYDKEGPIIVATPSTTWNTSNVITVSATDTSGVKSIAIDGTSTTGASGSKVVFKNGEYTVTAVDNKNNSSSKIVEVTKVDTIKPKVSTMSIS